MTLAGARRTFTGADVFSPLPPKKEQTGKVAPIAIRYHGKLVSFPAAGAVARPIQAKIWRREKHDHYVEEPWVSRRLFEEEEFDGAVLDPCCGFGHIVQSARAFGLEAYGTDIEARAPGFIAGVNFLDADYPGALGPRRPNRLNIVGNPPFKIIRPFFEKALSLATGKVAMICPTRRLNAAHWLRLTPLQRVLYITPRPNMPPGFLYREGELRRDVFGAREDFCWLVFEIGKPYVGAADWLYRDRRGR